MREVVGSNPTISTSAATLLVATEMEHEDVFHFLLLLFTCRAALSIVRTVRNDVALRYTSLTSLRSDESYYLYQDKPKTIHRFGFSFFAVCYHYMFLIFELK